MAIRRQSYSPDKLRIFDFLKSSKVSLQMFDIPRILERRGFPRNKLEDLRFMCESLEFPGKNVSTTEYKISGYNRGKVPILRNFSEINLSFYTDSRKFPAYDFFNTWIELTAPRDHVLPYYDDILVREGIELIQWEDSRDEASFVVRLINAYPTTVTSMPGNWGDDGLHRVNVSLTFEDFKVVDGNNVMNKLLRRTRAQFLGDEKFDDPRFNLRGELEQEIDNIIDKIIGR